MSETPNPDQHQPESAQAPQQVVYTYEASGIMERRGHVPAWLWAVVVTLLVWGGYYLVTYWNAPGTGT